MPSLSPLSPFSQPENGSDKQTFHERKILPYNRQQLYDIVADVNAYNQFVPFCIGSRVFPGTSTESKRDASSLPVTTVKAELTVGFLAFKESYVSTVTCVPHESVQAVASSSTPLFKSLETTWRFQPASPESPHASTKDPPSEGQLLDDSSPTLVSYDIAFAFANPVHTSVSAAFFGQVSKLMIKSFEERCLQVYGNGKQ